MSDDDARGHAMDAEIDRDIERYYDGEDDPYCCRCDGRGWMVTCIDDLCYGQDECIHGDPPTPCPECNPKSLKGDRL